MEAVSFLLLIWLTLVSGKEFYPVAVPSQIKLYGNSTHPARFRSLVIDGQYAYVGGQSAVYKLRLSPQDLTLSKKRDTRAIKDEKPDFKDRSTDKKWWPTEGYRSSDFQNYSPIREILEQFEPSLNIDTYKSVNLKNKLDNYLRDLPFGSVSDMEGNAVIETAQQYSAIYQSSDLTFNEHCRRQAEALSHYYGNDLQMSVTDLELLCATHIRGLTLMDNGKLFTIKTGVFGTMPISATGTNDYADWLLFQAELEPFITCLFNAQFPECSPSVAIRPPFSTDDYSGVVTDPPSHSDEDRVPNRDSYLMPSPENYFGKRRHCDNTPGPNRLIFDQDLSIFKDGVLIGPSDKESCKNGALSQLFLGGYHPDQKTFSHFSSSGNGAQGDKQAVYILTEIGQEKQLDLMVEYLNLPELYPLSSSASLAVVRLLINEQGDVDPNSIVVSNPFKYTWVTSPLNRFGRMNKMGSQEQVAYTPKPVALHEDTDYVYMFFREADWENTPVPSFKIRRSHHSLTSYSRALYFPWEKSFIDRNYIKLEETPGNTYEELYAPDYKGWQHMNDNLQVTGRVARVSKTDAGLPMGLQDANLFDLDHKLSLTTFQTFVKSRLTCRVPISGVPFVWRLRKDTTTIGNLSEQCYTEVRKPENLYSKDLHYRSVSRNEFVSIQREVPASTSSRPPSHPIIPYYLLSHCKGYRWSYVPKPKSSSALYIEYTELRDVFSIGDKFFGVFSTPFANEQMHTSKSMPNSGVKPTPSSAICSFSLSDIQSAFDGPFKKRDTTSGGYRPYGERDVSDIRPSPHSKENDEAASSAAETIKNMTIDFLDPTQPFSEEIRNIDLRRSSSRLNFFEEDVYGSRTMWDDVKTEPVFTESGEVFENIVAQKIEDVTVLYVATSEGQIYKIATTTANSVCRMTEKTSYLNWLNKTKSMSSIWDNEFYAYYNRTIDKTTFTASFKSHLTMEKDVKFPDDMLVKSDWDCTPAYKTTTLAVFKPFGDIKTKIWNMKLTTQSGASFLVLTTDQQVLQIPTVQCDIYKHCRACSNDDQCSWVNGTCKISSNQGQMSCSCELTKKLVNSGDDVVLPGLNQPTDLTRLQWYHNDSALVYQTSRFMFSYDTSLIIFNIVPASTGVYELKHLDADECLVRYEVTLTECEDQDCRYKLKYQEWCNKYNDFLDEMTKWESDYESLGYCRNLN